MKDYSNSRQTLVWTDFSYIYSMLEYRLVGFGSKNPLLNREIIYLFPLLILIGTRPGNVIWLHEWSRLGNYLAQISGQENLGSSQM